MGMVIHDDYWEAMKQLPKKQQAPFLMAVVTYGMEGIEPDGRPQWLPTFTAIKSRIELGAKRSAAGAKGGRQNKQNKELLAKQNQFACEAKQDLLMQQNEDLLSRVEDEDEYELGVNPPNPPYAWQCLNQLNEALGTTYSSMPPKCTRTLDRFAGKYTPEEVRQMVAYKRDEWQGSRFRNCLTPNTLFSPDHFEQYMNQSRSSAAEKRTYEQYD
jgi:uncharacterized phage protein (TIGR02220 family)